MAGGGPLAPREPRDPCMSIVQQNADRLPAVEADRDRLRAAITEALAHLDRHPPMHLEQCAPCRVRRTLTAALQGGAR